MYQKVVTFWFSDYAVAAALNWLLQTLRIVVSQVW